MSTQVEVAKLQEDLETMQPLLAQAAIETEETMEKIQKDTVRIFLPLAKIQYIYPFISHKRFFCIKGRRIVGGIIW